MLVAHEIDDGMLGNRVELGRVRSFETRDMARELASVIRDSVPEAKLVAGFDPFAASRRRFCQEFGTEPCETREALLDRSDIGAVLIATPNDFHAEDTLAAAAAGREGNAA